MNAQHYTPPPPLAQFVDRFWLHQGAPATHSKERVLPNGAVELVINLAHPHVPIYPDNNLDRPQTCAGGLLRGAYSGFFVIDTASKAHLIGVHFKPGGAFPFFPFPAHALHNRDVPLDAVWGRHAYALREHLVATPTAPGKFAVLEQFLLGRLVGPLRQHPAVHFALRHFQRRQPQLTVGALVAQLGLSPKRFIQLFSDHVGLTPKVFYRVQRFQHVLPLLGHQQAVDWAQVALACGYYDQAHFINDFRTFSGFTPTTYLAQRGSNPNHVPLP